MISITKFILEAWVHVKAQGSRHLSKPEHYRQQCLMTPIVLIWDGCVSLSCCVLWTRGYRGISYRMASACHHLSDIHILHVFYAICFAFYLVLLKCKLNRHHPQYHEIYMVSECALVCVIKSHKSHWKRTYGFYFVQPNIKGSPIDGFYSDNESTTCWYIHAAIRGCFLCVCRTQKTERLHFRLS